MLQETRSRGLRPSEPGRYESAKAEAVIKGILRTDITDWSNCRLGSRISPFNFSSARPTLAGAEKFLTTNLYS